MDIRPTANDVEQLGPTAVAFLQAVSQPHAGAALDATMNGSIGGMLIGGSAGSVIMPFYAIFKRGRVGWPKAGVIPSRMAQLGFLGGGISFCGLSMLERFRGKLDAASALAAGGLAGVAAWRFVDMSRIGAPLATAGVPTLRTMPKSPSLVVSMLSGAVMSSMLWKAMQTDLAEDELPEDELAEHAKTWSSDSEPWAPSIAWSGSRGVLTARAVVGLAGCLD